RPVARAQREARDGVEPHLHPRRLRQLSCDPGHGRAWSVRARPDARREPHLARRRPHPERPGAPRRVDSRSAAPQARRGDAESRPAGHRLASARALPGGPALMAIAEAPARKHIDRLERIWAERPGVLGWLTTVDHKRIGLLYFCTTIVLFL